MVIDPNNIANTGNTGVKNRTAPVAPSAKSSQSSDVSPSKSGAADSVSLSPEAQSIGRLESAIAASPEVNTQKVDAIRNALASGQYQIDADAIAEKLLQQDSLI